MMYPLFMFRCSEWMFTNINKNVFIKNVFYVVNCFLCCANITESVTLMLKYNFNSETRLRMWRVQWIKFVLRDVKGESITVNNSPFRNEVGIYYQIYTATYV